MGYNTSDAPARVKDQSPELDQKTWQEQIYANIEKEAAGRQASRPEGFKFAPVAAPEMVAMENSGALPRCRTSC